MTVIGDEDVAKIKHLQEDLVITVPSSPVSPDDQALLVTSGDKLGFLNIQDGSTSELPAEALLARENGAVDQSIEFFNVALKIEEELKSRSAIAYDNRNMGLSIILKGDFNRAKDLFGIPAVVELSCLMGYYGMVAMTLLSHEMPLQEGAVNLQGRFGR